MKHGIIFLFFASFCWLPAATLEWDRNPEPEVGRYNVWLEGTNGIQLLGTTTNLAFASTNFTTRSRVGVSAVSTNGFESDIAWSTNPGRPVRLRLSVQESGTPFGPWREMTNMVAYVEATSEQRYFRDRLEIQQP